MTPKVIARASVCIFCSSAADVAWRDDSVEARGREQ